MGLCHVVVIHTYLRRSQILLTCNRHIVYLMCSVFCTVTVAELSSKGLFPIQQNSKEQGQALVFDHSQYCFELMFRFGGNNYNSYSIFFLIFQNAVGMN